MLVISHAHRLTAKTNPQQIHREIPNIQSYIFFNSCYWVTPVGNHNDDTKICAHSDPTADCGWTETTTHLCRNVYYYQHVRSDEKNYKQWNSITITTYLFLYLSESAFQKSISSSFEENFGVISVSMANKSFNKRETGSMRTRRSQILTVCARLTDWKGIDF